MWHPDSDLGSVADRIREHFRNRRFLHAAGGAGVDVLFHSGPTPGDPSFDVSWDVTCPVAVVVLVDHLVARHPDWLRYIGRLGEQAEAEGFRARLIPVVMEPTVIDSTRLEEQAIRWDEWTGTIKDREARLLMELTYEFARMLRSHLDRVPHAGEDADDLDRHLEPIRVFLSHSKHDTHGESVAEGVRSWLHENSGLSSFLDVHDIPPGLRFSEVLLHHLERSVMLAIHTDSYSSREWCRREVIEAKRQGVPMVVADCLHEGNERAFPYLGNVPVVRMSPVRRDRIREVVSRLMDEVLGDMLWQSRVAALRDGDPRPTFMGRPPEFVSLTARGVDPDWRGVIVYPDPPLGKEEKDLLGAAWVGLRLLTMNEWLGDTG